ncbi:hypothetical protein ABTM69_20665, partial [Acinetobacter baumannii]
AIPWALFRARRKRVWFRVRIPTRSGDRVLHQGCTGNAFLDMLPSLLDAARGERTLVGVHPLTEFPTDVSDGLIENALKAPYGVIN